MYQIDMTSKVSVYEQIVEQTKMFILTGILGEGDQIPTVRQLSAQLSLNPNTIQKAIKELDRQGLIYSMAGRGCFVSSKAKEILCEQKRSELGEFEEEIVQLKLGGIKKEELQAIIERIYEDGR